MWTLTHINKNVNTIVTLGRHTVKKSGGGGVGDNSKVLFVVKVKFGHFTHLYANYFWSMFICQALCWCHLYGNLLLRFLFGFLRLLGCNGMKGSFSYLIMC